MGSYDIEPLGDFHFSDCRCVTWKRYHTAMAPNEPTLLMESLKTGRSRHSCAPNILIANEQANWGRCRRKLSQITDLLREQGLSFSLATSNGSRHAGELAAAAAADNANTIVVAGGDGTVNDVVNGLFACECNHVPRIGIIPLGSSNDFAKSLGIPQNLSEACRTVVNGTVRKVDVGRAGSHYFCTASCLGYFAEIAARSLQMTRFRGSLRYTIPALRVIRKMACGWEMSIRTDTRVFHGNYAVLLVGNAARFGGLTMLPGARCDDGLFDCLLIEMAGKWEALRLIPLVYRKALERHRRVTRFQTRSLSVSLGRPSQLCNDGEVYPASFEQIDYTALPRRLPVLCPQLHDLALAQGRPAAPATTARNRAGG
jgi:YegS/Rv2252/BmrU family lipid kinase